MSDLPPTAPRLRMNEPPRPKKPRPQYGVLHQRLRRLLLEERPLCEAQLEGCTGWSEEAHHKVYPATTTADYLATCKSCHRQIEIAKRHGS